MGWGKAFSSIGSVISSIPVVRDIAPISPVLRSSMNSAKRKETANKQNLADIEMLKQQNEALAQEKAIASESARLQEEEARKRTLFAGDTLGQVSERKKLLGL